MRLLFWCACVSRITLSLGVQRCDWSFRLYHHITYICCFVAFYLFSLWYGYSLWRCFVLLFEMIKYISVIIIISVIILLLWAFFHTSVNWLFSTTVWETASLFKSPRLFLVFCPISTMLYFRWSPPVLLFPSSPVAVPMDWELYLAQQLQLILPSISCFIIFQFSS